MKALFAVAIALLIAAVSAGVVELNSGNYESITGQEDKVVLVKVYADWCGHCKRLAPEYEEVGKHFEGNDKVVIAKFDAPANEDYARNTLAIRSFPTIFVYRHGLKTNFEGDRNKQALIDAVERAL